ncbi:MAG: cytochrome b/b6 domain-containing protein [Candidatus Thiodiazotropha sp. (ex. Lucinisca nassula)]|nr:cytochrome b/b6 domain-containing protein [Candidatus Thiodiazotropha sp. (ex. Lucinisca nassula)]
MAQYPLTCRYHLIRVLGFALTSTCLIALLIDSASADSGYEDPNDPSLFMPANKQYSSWLEAIGPGQGPVRRNSDKADAHENVESFYHARYCLSCHEGQQKNLHYARTELVCRDCHISKPVAGIHNPKAAAYAEHRHEKVCAKCHENAGPGMGSYVIHEKPPWSSQTQVSFPALYWSTMAILALAFGVFLFFMPYTSVWAWREIRQHRQTRGESNSAGSQAVLIERFRPSERWLHTVLIVCFMLLSLTGVAWMTIESEFGKLLALPFGGAEGAVWVHRLFGLLLLGIFSAHIIYLIRSAVIGKSGFLRGPDSLVWTWSDFKAIHQHMAWLFGRKEHPVFDRWSWWQKFDYWAVWWGLVIVGTTGLVMFDSVLTTSVLPGWMMNVARWIHKVEAILAMAHIFVVHFFIESYRPSAFPLNAHIFHGAAELEALKQEHPAWIERLQQEGNLQQRIITQPPRAVQIAFFGFGLSMVALGLLLLLGMLLFSLELNL